MAGRMGASKTVNMPEFYTGTKVIVKILALLVGLVAFTILFDSVTIAIIAVVILIVLHKFGILGVTTTSETSTGTQRELTISQD